ncbi:amidohydrolase [Sphingomonas sp.]|uniref:amidohydrolase n=1 Tax=Sphingomonas sp. TaxID=28214 RepID=UPI000DB20B9F|nr:amidohydrolase [Sphingomonas sp.]PZU06111.1 MAG: hydrolase [Sphingomonas sp.]
MIGTVRGLRKMMLVSALGLAATAAEAAQKVDLLLVNGKVLTVDPKFSVASAIAVSDGKVVATGGADLARRYTAARTIDLKGRTLMPGFTDAHVHMMTMSHRQISMQGVSSIAILQERIKAKARELGPGEWITGAGWDEALLSDKRNPTKTDLDAAAPDNPVVLTRAGGHSAVGNSAALKLARIDRSTPDPKNGLIERDADGEANGVIRERSDLYYSLVPEDSWEQLRPGFITSIKALLPLGITSFHSASTTIDDEPVGQGGVADPKPMLTYRRLRALYDEQGADLPRVTTYISYPGPERLKAFPHRSGDGDTRVRLGGIGENAVDGGFTGPTAWTLADYKGKPGFRGKGRFTDAELQAMVDDCARNGWQMALHAIGDAAIVQTVAAYDHALTTIQGPGRKGKDRRWFVDHFTIMPPAETMRTMARDGIMIAQQPNFLYNLEGRYEETLDPWRLAHNNSVATPRKAGIFVAFSSDNLPIGPMVGLYAAITRKGPSGRVHGPEEAVSRADAIRMYTANPAYLSWEEGVKGTLEAGKLADMIVLDHDPMTAPEATLLTTKIDMTFIGGKLVYDRTNSAN